MIRNLSLDELELILCDMYEMDEWLPNPVFDKNGFAKTSNWRLYWLSDVHGEFGSGKNIGSKRLR